MVSLRIVDFSADYLRQVKDFDCGSEDWAVWAANWIKNAPPFPSALLSMDQYGTRVWLYFLFVETLGEEFLVGFASLGITNWSISELQASKRVPGLIPMLAVATSFQGKSADKKLSGQISRHERNTVFASHYAGRDFKGVRIRPVRPMSICASKEPPCNSAL
jgi:hypothetical protein